MDVSELIAALDTEIAKSDETITWLRAELAAEQEWRENSQRERATVWSAYQRLSGATAPLVPTDSSWPSLSQVDAVERALPEAAPLHLTEVADSLASKGRHVCQEQRYRPRDWPAKDRSQQSRRDDCALGPNRRPHRSSRGECGPPRRPLPLQRYCGYCLPLGVTSGSASSPHPNQPSRR